MKRTDISVVLAVYNEEANLDRCLASVAEWAAEIVIVDGGSTDNTITIAERYGANIIKTTNPPIFHINKQKALDAANHDWILQLDADEVVTPELAIEMRSVTQDVQRYMKTRDIDPQKARLFQRHHKNIEQRDGKLGTDDDEVAAFFVARRNYFLGKAMRYAGMYPDGVIRLVKKGKAYFPCKSVHEQIQIDGKVEWLEHDLLHYSNPTLARYIRGADKYTDLLADEIRKKKTGVNLQSISQYIIIKPLYTFVHLLVRHKGVFDGIHGILFSLFSAFHFPIAYFKYVWSQDHQK